MKLIVLVLAAAVAVASVVHEQQAAIEPRSGARGPGALTRQRFPPARITVPITQAVTANATNTNSSVDLPEGWVTMAQPFASAGTPPTGAGIFIVAYIANKSDTATPMYQLWHGYLRSTFGPPSIPNVPVEQGQIVVLKVTGNSTVSGVTVTFNVTVDTNKDASLSGTSIVYEAPGSGSGVIRWINLAAPAAGADYATVSVPGKTRWRVFGFDGTLTASIAVANRLLRIRADTGVSGQDFWQVGAGAFVVASQAVDHFGEAGVGPSVVSAQQIIFGLPLTFLDVNAVLRWSTLNLQAADQWSAGNLAVEEWAMPL